ncbi:SDR family oxidoreductase [Jatrophihabitans endophyticus]|uniref:SDR family NAD(P)-dependent oxidoreductase n=1 Tax=Jatrophihabitans endophyticus TaxID=1206085 RepID=UPI001A0DB4D5|nr:SDR family oxidoreductase [Jatrophihabitans endophyticus]MBE7189648.1 SDR family oxidoreductase [Jatrophihabitans endophyticus]
MSTTDALEGKSVIVTGGAAGIGKAIVTDLAARGVQVLAVDRDDAVTEVAEGLRSQGRQVQAVVTDLQADGMAETVTTAAIQHFGAVDGLVNNAMAARQPGPFIEHTVDDLEFAFRVGPRATFQLMKAVHPLLQQRGGGSIVNFGSGAGTYGEPGFATYASAKEGQRALAKIASMEWGADGVRVNVVCPFALSEGAAQWAAANPDVAEQLKAKTSLRRLGDPLRDVAPVVAFLLGDDSRYLTGQTLFVDGGGGSLR